METFFQGISSSWSRSASGVCTRKVCKVAFGGISEQLPHPVILFNLHWIPLVSNQWNNSFGQSFLKLCISFWLASRLYLPILIIRFGTLLMVNVSWRRPRWKCVCIEKMWSLEYHLSCKKINIWVLNLVIFLIYCLNLGFNMPCNWI